MFEDEIPVGKAKDLRGQKFGRLTVLYRVKNIGKQTAWLCECECGNKTTVTVANLKSNHIKSCGCLNKEKTIERNRNNNAKLTGMRFGRLLALKPTEERKGTSVVWECLCDCGNIHKVPANSLTRGYTTSCGCHKREIMAETWKKIGENNGSNLIGQRFGKLVVKDKTEERKRGRIVWECKCDCGNTCLVSTSYLTSGDTKSCGCLSSQGEEAIAKLLKENNFNFLREHIFESCCFPYTNKFARFDFFVDNTFLIEFDGKQHFEYDNLGWNTKENYEKTVYRDTFKNQWCCENNIPLIRIPYWKLDTLCIEDLMLETTKFRVV